MSPTKAESITAQSADQEYQAAVSDCIEQMISEGRDQQQASAICSAWNYLAGILDGEGSTHLDVQHRVNEISIANTNYELLEWVQKFTGMGRIYSTNTTNHKQRRTVWLWRIARLQEVKDFGERILPFLRVKKLEVEVMVFYAQHRLSRPRTRLAEIDYFFETLKREARDATISRES